MPRGFFTIEQWKTKTPSARAEWIAVRYLDGCHSLADALQTLEQAGKPGLYRVVQTQRMIWAERKDGKLRLRKWHAMSPESLARNAKAFEKGVGRWLVSKPHLTDSHRRKHG